MYTYRNPYGHVTSSAYRSDLNVMQAMLVRVNLEGALSRLRRYRPVDMINAIAYVLKTGCQWQMLPLHYPKWKTVYHHIRSLSDRGWFRTFLRRLVEGRRLAGLASGSLRMLRGQSEREVGLAAGRERCYGNKRKKGVKLLVAVDPNGYVLGAVVTTANVHYSKGAIPLMANVLNDGPDIYCVKADFGYKGLRDAFDDINGVFLDCVKSNFGAPDFIPIEGRWVVERTFSWMENYRRLTRNYEKLLKVAAHMFIAGCVFFMLRYF